MDYRCKAVFASLSVVVMVLQHRPNVCWGAPMISPPAEDENSTTTATELQGDEFADLQQLRAGLEVLNTIVKNQLAVRLQLSDESKTALDGANNATGIRLALTVTCGLKRSAEALWRLPTTNGSAPSANLTLVRAASDSLFKTSCLWVDSLYRAQYPNSTMNFSCNSCEAMSGICNGLDTLVFIEGLERQYYMRQSLMLNETLSDQWLQENIERGSILPEVYNIIHTQ